MVPLHVLNPKTLNLNQNQDAWFETAKVDESLQAKKKKEREMAKEDTELTKEERWVIQKRIADTLQPGETVGSPLNFFC